jgi:predicted nucleic acid-binding protein
VKGDEELRTLDNLIALFRVIPASREIARAGGLYRRDYGKSHGVGLADAIVAATADVEKADLKTRSTKHYPMFKSLRPAYKKASEGQPSVAGDA